jgi:hypothetical protein
MIDPDRVRRRDAFHLGLAYKAGASRLLQAAKRIFESPAELQALLGLQFFGADQVGELK